MELVYLWVEEYKNIKNQGFNFSPRFTCKYENDELTIEEKKDYVSIFPENINVTVIVGENGSGKSSILMSIGAREKGFIVVNENNQLKVYSKNIAVATEFPQERLTSQFNKNILYYAMDDNYLEATKRHNQWIHLEKTVQLYVENYLKIQELNFEIFNFKPNFLFYEIIEDSVIPEDSLHKELLESIIHQENSNSETINEVITGLQQIDDKYFLYLLQLFGSTSELFAQLNLTEKLHPKERYLTLQKDNVTKYLDENKLLYLSEDEFNLVEANRNKKIPISDIKKVFGEKYIQLLFLPEVIHLAFNLFMNNGATFSSLSHGEKTVYSILLHTILFPKNDFLLLMDEPVNTLHPEWQRKFIYELIKQLDKYKKNAHIMMTSHSPFLLSDLPKENVIFLEKDNDGKCKNVSEEITINTFGANIHTLLSHGFFMKEGLMGEFAKNKINKVIDYLNGKASPIKDDDEAQRYVRIIGEPIVKKQLQRMLDSKKLDKMKEIDALKNQIESLQNRLEILENES